MTLVWAGLRGQPSALAGVEQVTLITGGQLPVDVWVEVHCGLHES